uniref:Putative RuvB domain containing protein n=1 Tax=viral metagenome TaxID=1070528 RepID=A0A6M3JFU3_9ZZZZ
MENILRPKSLSGIIGSKRIKQQLRKIIDAANIEQRNIPHMIFISSAGGLGKTTFALAIANELQVDILITNGGTISSLKDILPYLIRLKDHDILFIDEVHRMPMKICEFLYNALEDFFISPGKGSSVIPLRKFACITATTKECSLPQPFLSRFVYKFHLELYNSHDLSLIIKQSAQNLGLNMTDKAIINLAMRARGIPRNANNHLLWVRDYAVSKGLGIIKEENINEMMNMVGVEPNGMTVQDRKYIESLKKANRPVGLSTLVSMVGASRETVEQTIEPFLIGQLGLVQISTNGRILT